MRNIPDIAALVGVGCVAAGAWLLHPSAGLIVIGIVSLYISNRTYSLSQSRNERADEE